MEKSSKIHQIERSWEIGTHFFYGYFIPSDSYLMLYVTTWEMQGFFHQFLTAREDPAKSILRHLRLFFHNTVARTCSKIKWFLKTTNRKNRSGKLLFYKKKNQFQPRWNSKQSISKEEEGMDVILPKRRNIRPR